MFIKKYLNFKFSILFLILLFGCGQSVLALEFEVSPFALYEQGQEDIYIDGVRTKYGLGAVGATIETDLGSGFNIRTGIGYGYHPSAHLSLTVDDRSVSVTGPVAGITAALLFTRFYPHVAMNGQTWNWSVGLKYFLC